MYRVTPLVLAAIALCATLVMTTSVLTSAADLSREFLRQILAGISVGDAIMDRARVFAVEQLYTLHHAAETLLIPYISVCRHIVTDAIEEFPLLRSAEEYLLPQPSYENLTFHAERGRCVWTMSTTGLPADFSPHTGTLFLLLATNVCTAIVCLCIGGSIFAPLGIVWRITKALVRLAAKPKATGETVLEDLGTALATLAAAGINGLVFFATCLIFCSANIAMYVASLNIGYFTKRPAPEAKQPLVIYEALPDPRVPQLEEKVCILEREIEEKDERLKNNFEYHSGVIHDLRGQNEVLVEANQSQKLVIKGHMMMRASIDLNKSMYVQLEEQKQRCDDIQGDCDRVVEEKKVMEKDLWKTIGDQTDEIRKLKHNQRARNEEYAALLRSQEYLRERATMGDEVSRLQMEFQNGRIEELQKLVSSEKETLGARVKELLATIESLEAQLKERDELISTEKEAKQALEARFEEQEARHSSEQKSQKAHLMKGFERERKKLVDLSRLSSEARKAAEEKLKAAEEARKAADEARETAEQARKTAEKDSATNSEAHKAAEEALKKLKAAEEALKAAEDARKAAEEESAANLKTLQAAQEALKIAEEARNAAEDESASLRERLANRPASQDKGTQASSPPPSPRKTPSGSPSTTPPGSPVKKPPQSPTKVPLPPSPTLGPNDPSPWSNVPQPPSPTLGPVPLPPSGVPRPPPAKPKKYVPPVGQRPMLLARSVRKAKPNPSSSNSILKKGTLFPAMTNFSFNFLSGGSTPNIPGTNPAAPPLGPKTPSAAPSNPEPKAVPPAALSAPESKAPETAPSNPEPTIPPPGASNPEPNPELKTPEAAPSNTAPAKPPAAPSTAEPAPAEGGPSESKLPEPVKSTPAEGSSGKPTEASGEPPKAPEPAST